MQNKFIFYLTLAINKIKLINQTLHNQLFIRKIILKNAKKFDSKLFSSTDWITVVRTFFPVIFLFSPYCNSLFKKNLVAPIHFLFLMVQFINLETK